MRTATRSTPTAFRAVDVPLALIAMILAVTLVAAAWPRDGVGTPTPTPVPSAPAATTPPTPVPQVAPPAQQGAAGKDDGKGKGERKGKD